MNYIATLEYLDHLAGSGIKLELASVRRFLQGLGSPQDRVPVVHIAGSNGKGSVAAFLSSILGEHGYRVGLYTSPHLIRVEERIALDGQPLMQERFAAAATEVRERVASMVEEGTLDREPTYFEFLTGAAFHIFAAEACDLAVVETGLGGRLDATNTVDRPLACLITRVDLEHAALLGRTLPEIAREKAGIARPGVPLLTMESNETALSALRDAAVAAGTTLTEIHRQLRTERGSPGRATIHLGGTAYPDLAVPLPGDHQLENLGLALATLPVLAARGYPTDPARVRAGIARTHWPGRLERVRTNPEVLLDGAHNPAGARALASFLETREGSGDLFLVFGAMKDKDIRGILEPLLPHARKVFLTRAPLPRAAEPSALAELARSLHPDVTTAKSAGDAIDRALELARPGDTVLVAGSLILVGAARQHLTLT